MTDYSSKTVKMQGRDYLEVKWRLVWFREAHPKGGITTSPVTVTADEAVIHASVRDEDGTILGEGLGWCDRKSGKMGRYVEKAETAAIGRALGVAGFGTQFMGDELDEGDHLADSPVENVKLPTQEEMDALLNTLADKLAAEEEKQDANARLDAKGVEVITKTLRPIFKDAEHMEAFCEVAVGVDKAVNMSKKHARVLAWFAKQPIARGAAAVFAQEVGGD